MRVVTQAGVEAAGHPVHQVLLVLMLLLLKCQLLPLLLTMMCQMHHLGTTQGGMAAQRLHQQLLAMRMAAGCAAVAVGPCLAQHASSLRLHRPACALMQRGRHSVLAWHCRLNLW